MNSDGFVIYWDSFSCGFDDKIKRSSLDDMWVLHPFEWGRLKRLRVIFLDAKGVSLRKGNANVGAFSGAPTRIEVQFCFERGSFTKLHLFKARVG